MVYTVLDSTGTDAGFIAFEQDRGPTGADSTAAAVTAVEGPGGGVVPGGAGNSDLVVDKAIGDILKVAGGALTASPRVPTGPAGPRYPLLGARGYLAGTTGEIGEAGGVQTHNHGGSLDVTYRPRIYREMWWESYVPVLPPAPTISAAPTLTNGVGNEVRVLIPVGTSAGDPHPQQSWRPVAPDGTLEDLPAIDYSRVRVVIYRSAAAPVSPSPWSIDPTLGAVVDYGDVVAPYVIGGQVVPVELKSAWPVSATDTLWAVAFVWDAYGNGPTASAPVQATVSFTAPPLVDLVPPTNPTITMVWNDATGQYTVTIVAPNNPDVAELHVWMTPDNTAPDVSQPPTVIGTTPGQVHTLTFTPDTGRYTATPWPPAGWQWAGGSHHGEIEASVYAVAYDGNKNGSSPGIASNYQGAGHVIQAPVAYQPPPVMIVPSRPTPGTPGPVLPERPHPPVPTQHMEENDHATHARSRAYDFSGARADNQWGTGIMHTGHYGSNHGIQWAGAYIDLRHLSGWTATSMTLHWEMDHTYMNSGAIIELGWHSFKRGMPSTCKSSNNRASFGSLGDVHVPKRGPVSRDISTTMAQRMIDGQAFGFLFGGPENHSRSNYTAIDIRSVWVHIEVEK